MLQIISSSPGELVPAFKAMLANAVRLFDAKFGALFLHEGDAVRAVATHDSGQRMPKHSIGAVCSVLRQVPPFGMSLEPSRFKKPT